MHACLQEPQDQLAYAVHAAVLTNGFRLVAVGDAAQLDGESFSMTLQLDLIERCTVTVSSLTITCKSCQLPVSVPWNFGLLNLA